jgi:hypothetical protein
MILVLLKKEFMSIQLQTVTQKKSTKNQNDFL